jgi:hypothetical protein
MVRRLVRVGIWAGLVAGVGLALVRAAQWFRDVGTPPPPASWPKVEPPAADASPAGGPATSAGAATTAPEPDPDPAPAEAPAAIPPWVEAVDGEAPASHPVKGKLSSGIYHEPGMANYARTRPDRCYVDAAAAEADGLVRAKR